MNVIHIGNVGNFAYNYVKFLRKQGFEADLLVRRDCPETMDPAHEDPEIRRRPPKWIKYWNRKYPWSTVALTPMVRKYDLVHAYAGAPIYVQFLQKPFVAQSLGTDLRSMALKNNITGKLLRRGYKKAKIVFFPNPDQLDSIEKLGLDNCVFLYQPIDTKKYRPKKTKNLQNKIVFFSPVRLHWEVKGNDMVIRAFANLVKKNKNVSLKLMDWGVDVEKTKNLVKKLGIEKNVRFLRLMDKEKLIEKYNNSDVIVDQFKVKSFGLATLEAMACAKPVIMHYSVKHFKKFYKELPPILNAKNENEILKQMQKLCGSKKKRDEIGKKSRKWVEKYHAGDKVAKKLIKAYERIFKS